MGARQQLAEHLDDQLPDTALVVADYRRITRLDPPVTALVQVMRTTVRKSDQAPRGQLVTVFDIVVAVPYQDTSTGEDALDDATDEVLEVLERTDWVAWEKAERSTLNDSYIAYKIPTTAFTKVETTDG